MSDNLTLPYELQAAVDKRKGLSEGLLRIIDSAQKVDGHRIGYLFVDLPDRLTGRSNNPEQTGFSYGLRIPVQGKFDLEHFLRDVGAQQIIDRSHPQNPRYIADGILVQYSWPRTDVIELFVKASSPQKFETTKNNLVMLANRLYALLERTGHIKQFE